MVSQDDLRAGRMEQCCPHCGRWEAAGAFCSHCQRPMTEADYYRNGDEAARRALMPAAKPKSPPPEYRDDQRAWPPSWGPWPGVKRRPRQPSAGATWPVAGTLGL